MTLSTQLAFRMRALAQITGIAHITAIKADTTIIMMNNRRDKGRLKKLFKKARTFDADKRLSGLIRQEDWNELEQLIRLRGGATTTTTTTNEKTENSQSVVASSELLFGPCISWNKKAKRDWIDAQIQRDLFYFLLSQSALRASTTDKKRRHEDLKSHDDGAQNDHHNNNNDNHSSRNNTASQNSVASWVSIHNPVLIEHVAVLELHVEDASQLETIKDILAKIAAGAGKDDDPSHSTRRNLHVCTTPTKWFPDKLHVKSPSQTLLYGPQNKPPKLNAPVASVQDLFVKLLPLVIHKEEWASEGFPLRRTDNDYNTDNHGSNHSFSNAAKFHRCLPSDITKTQAKQMIESYLVKCSNDQSSSTGTLSSYVENRHLPAMYQQQNNHRCPSIFAIDCEMIRTTAGLELARVTLIQVTAIVHDMDLATQVVLDEIVRPQNDVLDYLTDYSGITAELLERSTLELEQVQASLLSIVSPHDIVIGHSIENDLKALRWIHERVIDTALLFRREGARFKYSLRHLTAALLKRPIQRADQPHCSQEDATASLHLAVRRAVEGPSFAIWDKRQSNRLAAISQESTVVCVGPSTWLQEHVVAGQPNAIHALTCESIHDPNSKAVSAWLTGKSRRARVVWALWKLTENQKTRNRDLEVLEKLLIDLLSKLHANDSIVMINLQAGYETTSRLAEQRRIRMNPKATIRWTAEEEEFFSKSAKYCQEGTTLWITAKH